MPLSGQIEFAGFPVIVDWQRPHAATALLRDNSFKWNYFDERNLIFLVIFLIKKSPAVFAARLFVLVPGFSAYFIVGMTNSAPDLMPDGQREVIVLVLVQNLIESVPCWLRSPKLEAFQPPKEW